MHPSTVDALRRYRWLRDMAEGPPAADSPFFVGTRGRRRGLPLGDRQVHRVFRDLRQQLGWGNRGAHHAPRIHDLRHNSEARIIPSAISLGAGLPASRCELAVPVLGIIRGSSRIA
jgi:hypothetical protein